MINGNVCRHEGVGQEPKKLVSVRSEDLFTEGLHELVKFLPY